MAGNVTMGFKYKERYWKKETYNLLFMLLMSRIKNKRAYILEEVRLGEKNFQFT